MTSPRRSLRTNARLAAVMGCAAQGSKVRGRPASNGNQRARGVHSVRGGRASTSTGRRDVTVKEDKAAAAAGLERQGPSEHVSEVSFNKTQTR
jgi:hypothetical protein